MFSKLRKELVYTDISPDIVEHDEDMDGDLWNYDGVDVYRGSFDPRYSSYGLQVYWLYDDNLKRVGVAEHESDSPEIYKSLWFQDTPFGTLFQEEWTSTGKTLWSKMSNEAYQDCLEDDFKSVQDWALKSNVLLVTPDMLMKKIYMHTCSSCNKNSLSELKNCLAVKTGVLDVSKFSILFLDEYHVLYESPIESRVHQLLAAYVQEQVAEEQPTQQHPDCLESPH